MEDSEYFKYLTSISWRGKLYRRLLIYPLIERFCEGRVLDVGCGLGEFLHRNNARHGTDINIDCVKFCQNRGLNVSHMTKDNLPFSTGSFETIIMDNVLEHISDPSPILTECRRVLSENGKIIILVPGKKGYSRDPDHKVYYDPKRISELANLNNFHVLINKQIPIRGFSRLLSSFCYFSVLSKID